MALIHDDLNKIQNRTVEASQVNSGASAVSESKTPIKIDFKAIAKNINIQEDVIVLIDSEDFKKLELNDQIKELKEKFFPSISDNEKIKEYLNIVKEALQQAYNAPDKVDTNNETSNGAKTSEVNTDEQEKSVKDDAKTSEKQSEVETLANDYIKKTNFKGNVDELRCELIQKAQTGEITEEEKVLLSKLYENTPQTDNEHKQPQMLLPLNELLNALKNSKSEERRAETLKNIENAYFKNDEEYSKLTSQKDKDKYIKNKMNNILKTLGINAKKPTTENLTDIFTLLQTAQQGNIPLDTLKGKSKTELNNIIGTAQQKILSTIIGSVNSQEGFKNLEKASDKALFTMKMILTMTDEEYKKLPADKQDNYAQEELNKFMAQIVPNWTGSSDANKEAFYEVALDMVKKALEDGELSKLKNITTFDKTKILYETIKDNDNIDPKLREMLVVKLDLLERLSSNGTIEVTETKLLQYLESKSKTRKLNEQEQLIYDDLKVKEKNGLLNSEDNNIISIDQVAAGAESGKYVDKNGKINVEAYIEDQISSILSNEKLSQKEKNDAIRELYKQTAAVAEENINYSDKIDELLKNAGYDNNKIMALKPRNLHINHAIGHGVKNEGTQASIAVRRSQQFGSTKEREIAENLTKDMPGMLKDNEQRTKFGIGIYDIDQLRSKYNEGLADRTQISKEDALEVHNGVLNSDKVSDADKAKGAQEIITFSAQNGADEQLYFGRELSKIDNPAVLEGLGAASNSIQDPVKKSQYNNHIETAAKNYPPEVQERVSKAIETGEVSAETKAKTSTYSDSTTTTTQTSKPQPKAKNTEATRPTPAPVTQAAPTIPTVPTAPTTAVVKTPTVTVDAAQKANNDTTQALADKRDRVAENILNYQEEVKQDLSARDIKDIKDTLVAISDGTIDENMEHHMKKIISTNNVEIIYRAIANMGSDILQTFITALTSYGSSEKILAFANVIKDDTAMLQSLYSKCTSESVRAKLLKLMPAGVIYSMIASGQITNLSELDPSLLYEFLMQNMSTMSLNSISSYLKYLPFEDRERIVAMLNGSDNEVNPEIASNDTLAQNSQIVETSEKSEQDNAQQQQQNDVQPEIKANEMTAVRNDGTEIKRKGSFGAVSSTDFSESYEQVTEKTGLSRSAQDEILTPGSPEWLRKYNKQQDVPPTTAFTMAALEEDNEFGMPFGSTKVGMGQKIRKKYPPQSFRFNA